MASLLELTWNGKTQLNLMTARHLLFQKTATSSPYPVMLKEMVYELVLDIAQDQLNHLALDPRWLLVNLKIHETAILVKVQVVHLHVN